MKRLCSAQNLFGLLKFTALFFALAIASVIPLMLIPLNAPLALMACGAAVAVPASFLIATHSLLYCYAFAARLILGAEALTVSRIRAAPSLQSRLVLAVQMLAALFFAQIPFTVFFSLGPMFLNRWANYYSVIIPCLVCALWIWPLFAVKFPTLALENQSPARPSKGYAWPVIRAHFGLIQSFLLFFLLAIVTVPLFSKIAIYPTLLILIEAFIVLHTAMFLSIACRNQYSTVAAMKVFQEQKFYLSKLQQLATEQDADAVI